MTKCLACGATYTTTQSGGTYGHVCPPIVDPKTGALVARANARNENPPDPATLAALVASQVNKNDPNYWAKANAIAATAIISAGAGVTQV